MRNVFLATSSAFILLLVCAIPAAKADDAPIYAFGNTLIPIHETTISLTKEILKFKRVGGHLDVDVYFEFFNPGKARTETIGFVTPPAWNADGTPNMPFISNFSVSVNDSNLKYKLSRFGKTGFPIRNFDADSNDFVFYFPARFRAGLNTVHHTYRLRANGYVGEDEHYNYSLTTGKMWANGEMEDFTLSIDMGDDYYYLPATFWKSAELIPWKVQGDGAIFPALNWYDHQPDSTGNIRMVKMHSGAVTCHLMHFRPDVDIEYGVPESYAIFWSRFWNKPGYASKFFDSLGGQIDTITGLDGGIDDLKDLDSEVLKQFSSHTLYILQNLPYAFHNCVFKSADLNQFFSQFTWYLPVPNRAPEAKLLDKDDLALIRQVRAEERRRHGSGKSRQ